MSTEQLDLGKKETKKSAKVRTRRNYQRDLARVADYCRMKIDVLSELTEGEPKDPVVAARISELESILAKAEGK